MMAEEATVGAEGTPVLRTLADKVNWLIDRAHPAGRGPFSNNEVANLIKDTTGEEVSYTTIWKLRNGQAQNPQKRLIEALARTFGVPAAFFFDDYDEQAGLLQEQVELLALVRDARISSAQLRAILEFPPSWHVTIGDGLDASSAPDVTAAAMTCDPRAERSFGLVEVRDASRRRERAAFRHRPGTWAAGPVRPGPVRGRAGTAAGPPDPAAALQLRAWVSVRRVDRHCERRLHLL
jgi:transcriptional regulator with XRE-family HTH domain